VCVCVCVHVYGRHIHSAGNTTDQIEHLLPNPNVLVVMGM